MTDELQAPRYRAQGDGAGFQTYVESLERNRTELQVSVMEHKAALDRMYAMRSFKQSQQPTFRFAFLRDLFTPKNILRELEHYQGRIEKEEILLVRARTEMSTLEERIKNERLAFIGARPTLVPYEEFESRRHQHS